jgi:hypothetical protein
MKRFIPKCENPKCKGWDVFTVSGSWFYKEGSLAIQACDECSRFKDGDADAQAYALKTSVKTLPARVWLYNSTGAVCTVRTYRTNPRHYGRLLNK